MNEVAILIPAYEPDEKLLALLAGLAGAGLSPLVVVDDGSSPACAPIFAAAEGVAGCTVLRHAVNLGKGRALKTAFNHLLVAYPGCTGAVTADADGQHTVADISACASALREHPQSLILGCRDFGGDGIPPRSRFGNRLTCKVLSILCGIKVSDTQTGLRGIPQGYMKRLLATQGERYEFEMNMLIDTKEAQVPMVEVPIDTIYLEQNRSSHFNPLRDSMRIYKVFFKFILSSLSSFVVDILLFTILVWLLKPAFPGLYILLSTIGARLVSSACNFLINKAQVFAAQGSTLPTVAKYVFLAICQLLLSAGLVGLFYRLTFLSESILKVMVDTVLFLISFQIQRDWVFAKK